MPNHRNVYISLATSVTKTGKFQLTPLVHPQYYKIDLSFSIKSLEINLYVCEEYKTTQTHSHT